VLMQVKNACSHDSWHTLALTTWVVLKWDTSLLKLAYSHNKK
jgi:hypothetical protein